MDQDRRELATAWPLSLASAAVLGTIATACMMPFVAMATLVAATMSRRQALTTIIGVWAVNQLLGFGALGYPLTAYALVWGVAIGGASVTATLIGRGIFHWRQMTVLTLLGAFVVAFAAYEALLFAFALVAGGLATFSITIIFGLFANEMMWFAGLTALYIVLTLSLPRLFGTLPRLRFS